MLAPNRQGPVYRDFHLFCGAGGGAKGFRRARFRVGIREGGWRTIGGIDSDAGAILNFERAAGCRGTVRDLMDRQQYVDFHGYEPPPGWAEATPADIRVAAGGERPDCVFLSAPCKSFSGLLSAKLSTTHKYRALSRLTLRGVWLMLEAWKDDPVPIILFENVPRIATRGRELLDQIIALQRSYGYAVNETTHDCGRIGNLAQSRRRYLKVARHMERVPAFLYEPPQRPLRAVGEVLGRMRLPGDPEAGPMHRVPRLSWKTWVRLAFVEAGSDWRSLNRLAIEDGYLRDYLLVPEMHNGVLGVRGWGEFAGTVAGASRPTNGAYSVADVRFDPSARWIDGQAYGVRRWEDSTGAVAGQQMPGQGAYSVADPRNQNPGRPFSKYPVAAWGGNTGTVIGGDDTGAYAVADPRPGLHRRPGDHYLTAGHYGVVPWGSTAGAVSAAAGHDNGRWSVADPRSMPAPDDRLVARIRALDGTWHRPFTTLELAALQSYYDPDDEHDQPFELLGSRSDTQWREWIGNMVPAAAAEAIASEIGRTLMLAESGETFQLSATPVWVRPLAIALSVDPGSAEHSWGAV